MSSPMTLFSSGCIAVLAGIGYYGSSKPGEVIPPSPDAGPAIEVEANDTNGTNETASALLGSPLSSFLLLVFASLCALAVLLGCCLYWRAKFLRSGGSRSAACIVLTRPSTSALVSHEGDVVAAELREDEEGDDIGEGEDDCNGEGCVVKEKVDTVSSARRSSCPGEARKDLVEEGDEILGLATPQGQARRRVSVP